jgi:hypothetical protein
MPSRRARCSEPRAARTPHASTHTQVYNRPMLLIDMDEFTRRWYCSRHGVAAGAEALRPIQAGEDRAGAGWCVGAARLRLSPHTCMYTIDRGLPGTPPLNGPKP